MSIGSVERLPLRAIVFACLAGLVLLVLLAYLPGRHGGFAFDDYPNIVSNTALRTGEHWRDWLDAALSSPAHQLPRPLSMLSLAVDLRLGGGDPTTFKFTNIAIHLLNLLLAYALAKELFRRVGRTDRDPRAAALLVAGLWAAHPVNATAVLYIVQRMESLCHVFVFAGLCCYCRLRLRQLRGEGGGWPLLYATIGGFSVAGILAKESAALLPLYAFCLEAWLFRFEGPGVRRGLAWLYLLLLVLPGIAGLAWLLPKALAPGAFSARDFSLSERLLTEPRVLCEYLRWTLLPDLSRLGFYHDDFPVSHGLFKPAATLAAMLALAALAVFSWLGRRRWPLATLGIALFLCAHALTATFLPLELVFEHRNYFASFGVCLAIVGIFEQHVSSPRHWRWVLGAGAALLLVLSLLTWLRAREWATPFSFARAEAARYPESPRATYYYGWVLANATGYKKESPIVDDAIAALERARTVPDAGTLPDQALLILSSRTGRPLRDEWWDHMGHRLRDYPMGAEESGSIAAITACDVEHQCNFPPERMMAMYSAALSRGDDPMAMNPYANYVLNQLGDVGLAERLWSECKRKVPSEPQYRISLAKLFIATQRYPEAEAEIQGLESIGRVDQYRREAEKLRERMVAAKLAAAKRRKP